MLKSAILSAVLILCPLSSTNAEIFTYKDGRGGIYITDDPNKKPDFGRGGFVKVKDTSLSPLQTKEEETKVRNKDLKDGQSHQEAGGSPPKLATTRREDITEYVKRMAEQYQVRPALVLGVIRAESDFNHNTISPKGARGLMQLMAQTAKELNVDRTDPEQNIEGGIRYLKHLLDTYNNDTKLALAAYNAGPGNVELHKGVPNFRETREYITRVYKYWDMYEGAIQSSGLSTPEVSPIGPKAPEKSSRPIHIYRYEDGSMLLTNVSND